MSMMTVRFGNAMINRLEPAMPFQAYQTYRLFAPLQSHWIDATCEQIECEAFLKGWATFADETIEQGQKIAHYIRHDKSRKHIERKRDDGMTVFWFPPGQKCFKASEHKRPIFIEPLYLVQGGDWRQKVGTRKHVRVEDWVDDFATHQDKLATAIQRG